MSDLVERLRDLHGQATSHYYVGKCAQEAADRIEALEAEAEESANRLEEVDNAMVAAHTLLKRFEAALRAIEDVSLDKDHEAATLAITAIARAALAPETEK